MNEERMNKKWDAVSDEALENVSGGTGETREDTEGVQVTNETASKVEVNDGAVAVLPGGPVARTVF